MRSIISPQLRSCCISISSSSNWLTSFSCTWRGNPMIFSTNRCLLPEQMHAYSTSTTTLCRAFSALSSGCTQKPNISQKYLTRLSPSSSWVWYREKQSGQMSARIWCRHLVLQISSMEQPPCFRSSRVVISSRQSTRYWQSLGPSGSPMVQTCDSSSMVIVNRICHSIILLVISPASTMQKQQTQQPTVEPAQQTSEVLKLIQEELENEKDELIGQIRNIKDQQAELEAAEQLTPEAKQENQSQIRQLTRHVLNIENKLHQLQSTPNIPTASRQQCLGWLTTLVYEPSEEQVQGRYNELIVQPNESSWTDATESQAPEDEEIWMVDDDIMQAMEQEEDENGEEIHEGDEGQGQEQQQKEEEVNIEELEQQFITGKESDHNLLFGKHDKFCVSVNGLHKQGLLVSGGGDDYLLMYRFPKEQAARDSCIHPYHMVKHTETVNKIEISHNGQYVFTMTDNEVLCTEIKTNETKVVKAKQEKKEEVKDIKQQPEHKQSDKEQEIKQKQQKPEPKSSDEPSDDGQPICTDMVCHHLGDVVALASGFQLQVYNIKGLKLYQTYYCDKQIETIAFTENGKQIIMACEDNRLRLLTPKTSEIVLVAGVRQHRAEISVLRTKGDIILSGCIDGYIGITSIKKATMTAFIGLKQTENVEGSINQLQFAGNYFMASSSYDFVDWYDFNKAKKLFQSPIEGASSDICWQGGEHQNIYNVSTIQGIVHVFDCRNPLKQITQTRAGNTIHKLWCGGHDIVAACEDGHARLFDIRKLL